MFNRAYFDHAATTPMPAAVREEYTRALEFCANPASQHAHGQQAREYLEAAREKIARHLGVTSAEVILTSGGTESINLALKGFYWQRNIERKRPVILVAEGEHHATIDSVEWLEKYQSAEIVWLPLDSDGVLQPHILRKALLAADPERVAVASVLWVNNEIGTVQPVADLAQICDDFGVPLHVDAVAALGQFSLGATKAAAISLSAHKIGGPVSSGALILARKHSLQALIHGGSQQRARSGTQDFASAAAFAKALDVYHDNHEKKLLRLHEIQKLLVKEISTIDADAILRGAAISFDSQDFLDGKIPARSLANVHFTFPGCQGDSLLFMLDQAGISVSTGSACTAGVTEISHVCLAIGLSHTEAAGALRFTYSHTTSDAEIEQLLSALPAALRSARIAGLS